MSFGNTFGGDVPINESPVDAVSPEDRLAEKAFAPGAIGRL